MIVNLVSEIKSPPIFYELKGFIPNATVFMKIEGLNIAESIKLKTAKFLLDSLEANNKLIKGASKVIESSSGNLALALCLLCKERGYEFSCVVDPNILADKEKRLRLYGARIIKVTQKDSSGGYLETRINTIKELLKKDNSFVWTNQYANEANIHAHYYETAAEILKEISQLDYLFVGAGTTGTLMGCERYFREYSPKTKVIAVDARGSVTFGDIPQKRLIPGIGTSKKPEIADPSVIQRVLFVDEIDAIKMCRYLLSEYGLFCGGSTGSVMHAVKKMQQEYYFNKSVIVAISPDFGGYYQDTIYNDLWVKNNYKI